MKTEAPMNSIEPWAKSHIIQNYKRLIYTLR